jgi:hypothetical protein
MAVSKSLAVMYWLLMPCANIADVRVSRLHFYRQAFYLSWPWLKSAMPLLAYNWGC